MSGAGWVQFAVLGVLVAISTPLLAKYMYRVYFTKKAPGDRVFLPVENLIYRICGVDPEGEQRWRSYALAMLAFSLVSVLFTYALLRLQGHERRGVATQLPDDQRCEDVARQRKHEERESRQVGEHGPGPLLLGRRGSRVQHGRRLRIVHSVSPGAVYRASYMRL